MIHDSIGVSLVMKFFEYNWQVRDQWFTWCHQLTTEELLKNRLGGVENILYTLFHIIDVEYSWIRAIQGKEDIAVQFADYQTLNKVKSLSNTFRTEIIDVLQTHSDQIKDELVFLLRLSLLGSRCSSLGKACFSSLPSSPLSFHF